MSGRSWHASAWWGLLADVFGACGPGVWMCALVAPGTPGRALVEVADRKTHRRDVQRTVADDTPPVDLTNPGRPPTNRPSPNAPADRSCRSLPRLPLRTAPHPPSA
ncbi:hypothetical protein GCM10022233_83700 [Streptomyces shaanxiensis]|uniref:Uncharacterized protein n=1 Tax=Streptomyces shaanxiensis TaxID=653357 RepID=A0ABP7WGF3_9ACTN